MEATYSIRPARPDERDAVAEMDRVAFEPMTSPGPPFAPEEDFFARVPAEDHLLAVAEDGGIVGYVRLGHPTPLPSNAHVIEIKGLAVHPAHRRRGLGERLLEAAVAEARRRGARKLSLRVLGGNESAQRLYERAGFTVQGRLVDEFQLDGQFVDDVLMARRL